MKLKKLFASLLSIGLLLSPIHICAEDSIGTVYAYSEDPDTTSQVYYSIDDAWHEACAGIKICLTSDWNLSDRLIVPEGANVTIEMNGYKIDRGLSSTENDGEVIYLSKNSTLTLTGNSFSDTEFSFNGYKYSSSSETLSLTSGGLVTGGYSANGAGGIHMKKGTTLNLEHVAIAGNKGIGEFTNDGGGINMNNDDCTVNLTNSLIMYNCARAGGGIYVAGENSYINMISSEISYNYAKSIGGGICSYNDATYVTMNQNSRINDNYAVDNGGGVYFYYPYCQVVSSDSLAAIENNESSKDGGGIYFATSSRGDTMKVSNITFNKNKAKGNGGAIYVAMNGFSILDSRFYENKANNGGAVYAFRAKNLKVSNCTMTMGKASSNGGGMYINGYNATFSGTMNIKGNTSDSSSKNNVYLNEDVCISGNLEKDSSVGITTSGTRKVVVDVSEDNGTYFLDESDCKITYSDGALYKESNSALGSIFGNSNVLIAAVGVVGICVVGIVLARKKNREEA